MSDNDVMEMSHLIKKQTFALYVRVCVGTYLPMFQLHQNYWAHKHDTWHKLSSPRSDCHKGFDDVTIAPYFQKMQFLTKECHF